MTRLDGESGDTPAHTTTLDGAGPPPQPLADQPEWAVPRDAPPQRVSKGQLGRVESRSRFAHALKQEPQIRAYLTRFGRRLDEAMTRLEPPEPVRSRRRARTRRGWGVVELAEAIWEDQRIVISSNHISHLCKGTATSLSSPHHYALAQQLGLPMEYFTRRDDEGARDELRLVATLQDPTAQRVLVGLSQLDAQQTEMVQILVEGLTRRFTEATAQRPVSGQDNAPAATEP